MQSEIKNIVIVGGGTAGWITAGLIAAKHKCNESLCDVNITLIESPNISSIGVGEGTWPSMRETLKTIGINEADLFLHCDASFKQASKFIDWYSISGNQNNVNSHHHYYHPFSLPQVITNRNLANYIGGNSSTAENSATFAQLACYQSVLCEQNLSPKHITHKAYDFIANYGYHLDATKFSELLKEHCIKNLNVKYVLSHITNIQNNEDDEISHVLTDMNGAIYGDLFVDCSGAKSLLLGQHYKIPFCSKKHYLFNDSALAVQIAYKQDDSPIASCTHSTAKSSGWIWDIGLQSRRGIGHTYSSQHTSELAAENELRQYIQNLELDSNAKLSIKKLDFTPGYYEKFWHKNCVGMASGFIEPLEASALAMIEQSAHMISDQLPKTKQTMSIVAKRFNEKFTIHWQQIIEFLKLHYVLSQRDDSDYWLDNKKAETIPDSLKEMLEVWKYQPPSKYDIPQSSPLFPAASYQYVLYGMNFHTQAKNTSVEESNRIKQVLNDVKIKRQQLARALEPNRALINKIKQYGLTKI